MSNKVTKGGSHTYRADQYVMIEYGEYWQYAPATLAVDTKGVFTPDNIYILVDVMENIITKKIQTVALYIPKAESGVQGSKHRLDIDEFLRDFKHIPKDVAEQIRKREILALEGQANQLQNDIKKALSDPNELLRQVGESDDESIVEQRSQLHRNATLPSPEMMASSNSGVILASNSPGEVAGFKKQFENQALLGNMANKLAIQKSAKLEVALSCAADLMMESAVAIKGKADDMRRRVQGVLSKVDIMKLYLGEDVVVHPIREGASANLDERYKFYSSMVYMDDEIATDRLFSEGQFDFTHRHDFMEKLKTSDTLFNRIMSSERCIVVIRPTRNDRRYDGYHPQIEAQMNAQNRSSFLLVRDGEKLHAIHSNIHYQKRMFPTDNEMSAFFEFVHSNSTNLVDQQRRFESMANMYHAVIAILQGVVDRQGAGGEDVFGELPEHLFGNSFINPTYINRNCHFVNDEDNLLANKELPDDVRDWCRQYMSDATYAKGDIVVYRNRFMSETVVPAAYKFNDNAMEHQTDWTNTGEYDELRSKRISLYKGQSILLLPLKNCMTNVVKNFRVFFKQGSVVVANIMTLEPDVLDKILESRQHRHILCDHGYMELLVEARALICDIKAKTKTIRVGLKRYYPKMTDDQLHLMVLEWLRDESDGDDGSHVPEFQVANVVTKIVNAQNKAMAFSRGIVDKAVAEIESKEWKEKVLFSSLFKSKLYIFSVSLKSPLKYVIPMVGVEYPFFNMYEVDISGQIKPLGVVGNDIQNYPVSEQFVESLSPYKLHANRLTGKDCSVLAKGASEQYSRFTDALELMKAGLAGSDNDKFELIVKLVGMASLEHESVTKSSSNVLSVNMYLPISLNDYYSEFRLEGFWFNYYKAIFLLRKEMTSVGRKRYAGQVNELMRSEFDFGGFLKFFEERGLSDTFVHLSTVPMTSSYLSVLSYSTDRLTDSGSIVRSSEMAQAFVGSLSAQFGREFLEKAIALKDTKIAWA